MEGVLKDKLARAIFEKHIGINQECQYKPIKPEDVMNCINEALNIVMTKV